MTTPNHARAATKDGMFPDAPQPILPVEVRILTYGEGGKFVRRYAVTDSNHVEWCRCEREDSARLIALLLNKQPRVPVTA